MQLNQERTNNKQEIQTYIASKYFEIDNKKFTQNIIITHQEILLEHNLITIQDLDIDVFKNLLKKHKPDVIIMGTGLKSHLPNIETLAFCQENKITLNFMTSDKACMVFNSLLLEKKDVLAIMFI